MRIQFNDSDLEDSFNYYRQFIKEIDDASYFYIKGLNKSKEASEKLSNGWLCYVAATKIISDYNRVCRKLVSMGEWLVATQLIRMELDILTALYADTKWPFQILYKIYWQGKSLGKIKKKGKNLNPGDLRKEIDAKYSSNICEAYDYFSSFVHPSKNQLINPFRNSSAHSDSIDKNYCLRCMVVVNQIIGYILADFAETLKSKTNWEVTNKGGVDKQLLKEQLAHIEAIAKNQKLV